MPPRAPTRSSTANVTAAGPFDPVLRAAKRIAGGNGVLVLDPKRSVGSKICVRLKISPGGTYVRTVRVRG